MHAVAGSTDYRLQTRRCNVSRQRESFKRKGDGQRERSTNPRPGHCSPPVYSLVPPRAALLYVLPVSPLTTHSFGFYFFYGHRPGWFSQHPLLVPNYFLFPRYWVLVLIIIIINSSSSIHHLVFELFFFLLFFYIF